MSDMNSANDQLLEMFLFEMSSLLDQLDEVLLGCEKRQSLTEDSVNEIFRIMHTIKGSSAMMEFHSISTVTHRLEDTFYFIRENGIDGGHFTPLFDLVLDATDFLKTQLDAIQNGDPLAEGNDELIARIVAFLAELNGTPAPAQPAPPEPPEAAAEPEIPPESPAEEHSPEGGGLPYRLEVWFDDDCGMENLRAFMLINTLNPICHVIGYEPDDIAANPETAAYIAAHGFSVTLETGLDQEQLRAVVEDSLYVKLAHIIPMAVPQGGEQADVSGDGYQVDIRFEDDCGMENLRAFMLVNSLRQRCKITGFDPADIERDPQTADIIMKSGFHLELETAMPKEELQAILEQSMHVKSVSLAPATQKNAASPESFGEPAAAPVPAAEKAGSAAPSPKTAPAAHKPVKQNLINVSLSKLDELMDLMGELVITESMVTRSPDLRGLPKLDNFHKSARQLRKLTDELQDMVMSIRMVPVSGTFQKMQRIVRDMCRALGKEADLVTMGEDTDIDKTIIDGIGDPIMHLVRNSMDHGLEMPEERVAAGKPAKGTVTLSAQNTGGEILITVSDDGKGLDAEKLLEKAKHNGLLTKPAGEYTEKEAFMLLTLPGFSTKEAVTEYSGRGVGMDVVKKNIEKIGGTVHIESKKGFGMSVFLKIPLTLAIVDGMDISVGGGVYTLQITAINESFKATRDQVIVDTDGNEMIMLRGSCYPIVRLHELLGVPNAITDIADGILIWAQSGDNSICLFADALIGEQQIVVKPLPKYLQKYNVKSYGVSGCTILGDGNISLILDVGSIIEKVMEKR